MGTATALEFLGPLGVAVVRGRRSARIWPVVAAAGVLLLTEPWRGTIDGIGVAYALAAGASWAAYILLTQKVADAVSGLQGLAVSMPIAGLVATMFAGPSLFGQLTWQIVLIGLGLAVLVPIVPFSLELLALRRLTTGAFGVLMSLEPAAALLVGLLLLRQVPGPAAVFGVALVVTASIGAQRSGARGGDTVERNANAPSVTEQNGAVANSLQEAAGDRTPRQQTARLGASPNRASLNRALPHAPSPHAPSPHAPSPQGRSPQGALSDGPSPQGALPKRTVRAKTGRSSRRGEMWRSPR